MRSQRRLIGRDADLASVMAALARDGRCTVVGPGGVGKSALARAVADIDEQPTAWVDAEPLPDVDALADELLRQLGAERLPGQGSVEAVVSALDGGDMLLVLDGVEHLGDHQLAAAVETMPIAPDAVRLLVTSRRPLGPSLHPLARLAPLPTAGPGSPGEQLLTAELRARGADLTTLTADHARWERVLSGTGGLPAAILLTADHVTRFGIGFGQGGPVPIDAIIERCLVRTLDLLTEAERRTFLHLGLTAGPFTLDVVTGLTGERTPAARGIVGTLVEHGLVLVDDDHVDLLPPVRDGARDLLQRAGLADAALDRAVAWAVGLADSSTEAAAAALAGNLDTALHVARLAIADPHRHPGVVPLVRALFDPMYRRLRWRELLGLLETLTGSGTLGPRDQAETALLAAHCASGCDTIARARSWLDEAHRIAHRLDDRLLQGRAWSADAWLALDVGDHRRAFDAAGRSLAFSDGDPEVEMTALRATAETALAAGDLDRAERVARDVLARSAGPTSFDALLARSTLGWCLVERGRYAEAAAHARLLEADSHHDQNEASETSVEAELIALAADPGVEPRAPLLGDQRFSWWMRLEQRIRLAARVPIHQQWETVLHAAADVVVLADQVPLAHPRLGATILLGDAALAGGDLRQACQAYEQALRDAVRSPARLRAADALDGMGALAQGTGQHQLAAAIAGTAASIRENAHAVAWPRPSLPVAVPAASAAVPDTWIRDGRLTSAAVDEITRAIRPVEPTGDPWAGLTHAERQIAHLVRRGLSNSEVADRLVISRRTVESHLSRIFRKLAVRSRTQLMALPGAAFDASTE